jgi:hypothetical protein
LRLIRIIFGSGHRGGGPLKCRDGAPSNWILAQAVKEDRRKARDLARSALIVALNLDGRATKLDRSGQCPLAGAWPKRS